MDQLYYMGNTYIKSPLHTMWSNQASYPLKDHVTDLSEGSVERGNACHYPLKGCRQGQRVKDERVESILLGGTHHTGLQGKDQENLTGVLWWQLWPLYTTTVFVHVYTTSPIKDKHNYCYWSSKA